MGLFYIALLIVGWSLTTATFYIAGVSHLTVPDDLAGVMAILDWLAFVPKVYIYCSIQWVSVQHYYVQHRDAPLLIMPATDPIDRTIQYVPTKAPYDPRWMLAGINGQFRWQVDVS